LGVVDAISSPRIFLRVLSFISVVISASKFSHLPVSPRRYLPRLRIGETGVPSFFPFFFVLD
jgi:hypothetical protein